MPAITSALSAICGTHFGETNAVASMTGRPASVRRSISSIFTDGGHRSALRSANRRAGRLRRSSLCGGGSSRYFSALSTFEKSSVQTRPGGGTGSGTQLSSATSGASRAGSRAIATHEDGSAASRSSS